MFPTHIMRKWIYAKTQIWIFYGNVYSENVWKIKQILSGLQGWQFRLIQNTFVVLFILYDASTWRADTAQVNVFVERRLWIPLHIKDIKEKGKVLTCFKDVRKTSIIYQAATSYLWETTIHYGFNGRTLCDIYNVQLCNFCFGGCPQKISWIMGLLRVFDIFAIFTKAL